MAGTSILKQLKTIISCLYDNNGNLKVSPTGELAKRNLSEVRLKLLRDICELLLKTEWLTDETKMYISDKDIKYRTVNEKINDAMIEKYGQKGAELLGLKSERNTQSKIQYDAARIEKELGKEVITHIVNQKAVSIEMYQIKVARLFDKFNNVKSLRENFALRINEDSYISSYDGNFISEYEDILRKYLVSTVKREEQELNNNKAFVGYFNFLLSGAPSPNEQVESDRKKLIALLSGENRKIEDRIANANKKIDKDEDNKSFTDGDSTNIELSFEPEDMNVLDKIDSVDIQSENVDENGVILDDEIGEAESFDEFDIIDESEESNKEDEIEELFSSIDKKEDESDVDDADTEDSNNTTNEENIDTKVNRYRMQFDPKI